VFVLDMNLLHIFNCKNAVGFKSAMVVFIYFISLSSFKVQWWTLLYFISFHFLNTMQ